MPSPAIVTTSNQNGYINGSGGSPITAFVNPAHAAVLQSSSSLTNEDRSYFYFDTGLVLPVGAILTGTPTVTFKFSGSVATGVSNFAGFVSNSGVGGSTLTTADWGQVSGSGRQFFSIAFWADGSAPFNLLKTDINPIFGVSAYTTMELTMTAGSTSPDQVLIDTIATVSGSPAFLTIPYTLGGGSNLMTMGC